MPFRLLLRIPVPWVFILTYLFGTLLEIALPLEAHGGVNPKASLTGGGVAFAIGAIVAGWGLVIFRRARTTTIPGRVSSQLVTWGPYRFTRNPMYIGLTIAYLGEALLLRQVWPAVLLPVTIAYVNWVVIPVEEAKLAGIFGDDYARYKERVRRWI